MDVKQETIEMLRALKLNCCRGEKPNQTIINDVSEESFLWVINQAIALIKDGSDV